LRRGECVRLKEAQKCQLREKKTGWAPRYWTGRFSHGFPGLGSQAGLVELPTHGRILRQVMEIPLYEPGDLPRQPMRRGEGPRGSRVDASGPCRFWNTLKGCTVLLEVQKSKGCRGCLNEATTSRTYGTGGPLHRSVGRDGQSPARLGAWTLVSQCPPSSDSWKPPSPGSTINRVPRALYATGVAGQSAATHPGQLRAVGGEMQRSAHGEFRTLNAVPLGLLVVPRLPRRTFSTQNPSHED
jgi:hypothetical protein